MVVPVQVSVAGWYLPPLSLLPVSLKRPHTIISLPVQIAVCRFRALGALMVVMAVQLSVEGLYLPPVFKDPRLPPPFPPQTIISLPVQTAV